MTNLSIDEIVKLLEQCDDWYFNSVGDSEMTDAEYDSLKKTAFRLDPSHPYFTRIGAQVRGGKIRLPYTMGSLTQIYDGDYSSWAAKYANDGDIVITRKKDGISAMLEYRDGKLAIGYSRGNGIEGADITRHINHVKNVPQTLVDEDYLVVRGELIMKNETFKNNWSHEYKNARGTVAGTMNRDESRKDIISDIDFIAYEIVASNQSLDTAKIKQLEHLHKLGFQTVNYEVFTASDLNESVLAALVKDAKINSEYELDGIVLTVNKIDEVKSQRSSVSLNPEHSCKFKINSADDIKQTVVTNVLWEISKWGLLKPRIEIHPVELFGTTVTYASGYNARYIADNKIGKGAKIAVTKAGQVIPECVEVIVPAAVTELPDNPSEWRWSDSGVEIELIDIDNNPIVKMKQLLDFVETLKVDLLKESSLSKIFNAYKLYQYDFEESIMLMIDLLEQEWVNVLGTNGSKIHASLHRRLQNLELSSFLGGVKYFGSGFGVRKAKKLLEGVTNEDDVWDLTVSKIASLDGFDSTAQSVYDGLKPTKKLYDRLKNSNFITVVQQVKTSELSDVNVVMTGFRDADLAAEIEKRGGKNGSSVSKKTTHLLTYDTTSNSGKAKKARELGVQIMSPDQFKDLYNL